MLLRVPSRLSRLLSRTRVSQPLSIKPGLSTCRYPPSPIPHTIRPTMLPALSLLLALSSVANAWSITATLVSKKIYTLNSSTGAIRNCDGLPIITSPVDFFDRLGNTGASTIELYPGINCTGTKKVGVAGRNDVNPNTVFCFV